MNQSEKISAERDSGWKTAQMICSNCRTNQPNSVAVDDFVELEEAENHLKGNPICCVCSRNVPNGGTCAPGVNSHVVACEGYTFVRERLNSGQENMKLPEGKICALCVNFSACASSGNVCPNSTICDFSPSKFREMIEAVKKEEDNGE